MQTYEVSRTVVREALSRLQASGLVETRHGIGTFVRAAQPASTLMLNADELTAAVDVMAVLELRISLETESAGLAALRRSPEQLQGIRMALQAFEIAFARGEDTVAHDLAFHTQIDLGQAVDGLFKVARARGHDLQRIGRVVGGQHHAVAVQDRSIPAKPRPRICTTCPRKRTSWCPRSATAWTRPWKRWTRTARS